MLKMKIATAGLLMTMLGGCAGTGSENGAEVSVDSRTLVKQFVQAQKLTSVKKVSTFNLHNWKSLDDRHLIISARRNEPYLVSLRTRCQGLRHALSIATDNRISTLYANTDSIIVLDEPVQRCRISELHALTPAQVKQLTELL